MTRSDTYGIVLFDSDARLGTISSTGARVHRPSRSFRDSRRVTPGQRSKAPTPKAGVLPSCGGVVMGRGTKSASRCDSERSSSKSRHMP